MGVSTGDTLDVTNWVANTDYFYSNTTPTGTNQIVFTGYSGSATRWQSYTSGPENENQISPVPETSAYGALFMGISIAGILLYRSRRSSDQ